MKKGSRNMEIRSIDAAAVTETVRTLFMDMNYHIGNDIAEELKKAMDRETSDTAKNVIGQILKNHQIAADEEVPMCQDTGMAILFVEYGERVVIENGSFEEAVQEGVRRAYIDGYLRKSVVDDPVFDRVNTKDNTPAIIYTTIVKGDRIRILAGCKGFGSENMSAVKMLTPSAGLDGVKKFIMDTVNYAGPNPCPPIVVGVGIGGSFEKAAMLAKKATLPSSRQPLCIAGRGTAHRDQQNRIRSCGSWRCDNGARREHRNFPDPYRRNACGGEYLLPCRKT